MLHQLELRDFKYCRNCMLFCCIFHLHVGLDGCAMKRFEVSPDGRYLAFIGRHGSIHLLTAQV